MLGVNARSVLLALGLKLSRRCSSGDCALTASSTGWALPYDQLSQAEP